MNNSNRPKLKVARSRREYNKWVADETLEDYSLRYAAKSYRKWSEFSLMGTALGGISFLALEAIGGFLAISFGFQNSFYAIIFVSIIIFITSFPITYYAAKHNLDMDLLTRGAGFGYFGSTITSLIYASFTFIFFALEASIMAQALTLVSPLIPLPVGYIISTVIIIPMVYYGVTFISKFQKYTQVIWIVLMVSPIFYLGYFHPDAMNDWYNFAGKSKSGSGFNFLLFGTACGIAFSLIAQIGEQVDYLRFLPDLTKKNKFKWWSAMILGGPGWILLGGSKMLAGAFLTSYIVTQGKSYQHATEPIYQYLGGYEYLFHDNKVAFVAAIIFVIISQVKINVTNAYAGSLAWSNFFSRITHYHPGRVVWLIFNLLIAYLLMQFGAFATLEKILSLYSNVAIAWIGAIFADLVIAKPLGLSPSYIEFKRAHLYNVNPVGFLSTLIASIVSIIAYQGFLGEYAQAFSPFIAVVISFILVPVFAVLTNSKYYLVRKDVLREEVKVDKVLVCAVCYKSYEIKDMAFCPFYQGHICSLCCSLDSRCNDRCKLGIVDVNQESTWLNEYYEKLISYFNSSKILQYFLILISTSFLSAMIFNLVYLNDASLHPGVEKILIQAFIKIFCAHLIIFGVITWIVLLLREHSVLSERELEEHNQSLNLVNVDLAKSTLKLEKRSEELDTALAELKQSQDLLISNEKLALIGELTAGVVHELKNPAAALANANHLIEYYTSDILDDPKQAKDLIPEIKKVNRMAKENLDKTNNIIESMLSLAREKDQIKMECDLIDFIYSNVEIAKTTFLASHSFSFEIIRKHKEVLMPSKLFVDDFSRVVLNIVSNALYAMWLKTNEKKLLNYSPVLTLNIYVEDNNSCIEITDNGIGLDEDTKNKLFKPFFTLTPSGEGTGLGMSLAKDVVKRHGGKITVTSELGEWTTFLIVLPIGEDL